METVERVSEKLHIVTELRGSYPDLKLPADIDLPGLEADLGFLPKLVTLPIGRVDAVSNNGRIYTEQAVRDLVDAVNQNRLEGAWGHMRDDDRPYVYVPPSIRWVFAELINGTAWGLGIPLNADTDKYFRAAARMNAKVGTSVYGLGDSRGNRVVAFKGAEKIDIADPTRVGIPDTAAVPKISEQEGSNMEITLKDVPEAVRQQIVEQFASKQNGERITEMEKQLSELQTQVQTLTTERDAARGEASKLLVTYARAKITEQVKLEPVQKLVERMVGIREKDGNAVIENVTTVAEIDAAIKAVIEDEAIVEFNKDSVKEMMGPPPQPPMSKKNGESVLGEVIPG